MSIKTSVLLFTGTVVAACGCMYFPSICKNKKRMEDIERRLVPLRAEYDQLYLHNKKDFLNLMTANLKNAYISYYNDYFGNLNTLQEIESSLSDILELKFPIFHEKYKNAQNVTSKEYLNSILDYRISDIKTIFNYKKKPMAVRQWKGIADKITKKRIQYEKDFGKFLIELNDVTHEKVVLAKLWYDVILSFKYRTSIFKKLIEVSVNYTQFNADVGILQLPINPIFDIRYKTLSRQSIQSAQERVLSFVRDKDNNIKILVDRMYARSFLYKRVLIMTDFNTTIDHIFESITAALKFSLSKTRQKFGTSLTKKDLACAISLLRPDLNEYDFFPLAILRPKCNLTMVEYKKNEQIANTGRNANQLSKIVSKTLNSKYAYPSLANLTEYIKNVFFAMDNTRISRYGSRITEKDVICSIATQFPSKQEYDFISLIPFRSNCETVDENTFLKLKAKAASVKGISLKINKTLNICKLFKFCPCLSMIANYVGISIENVINLIRLRAGPNMTKYCGTTGCGCVDLK